MLRATRAPVRSRPRAGAARRSRPRRARARRAFQADDADDLGRIYQDLGSRVATETERREITVAFAAGGALLLAAAAALGLRATARLP